MNVALFILGDTPLENPSVSDAVPYLAGFLIVLVTLAALMAVCMAVSKALKFFERTPAPPEAVAKPEPQVADDTVPPEILAVIAAAVATTVGRGPKIVSIRPSNTSWSQAGRQQIQTSHNIR